MYQEHERLKRKTLAMRRKHKIARFDAMAGVPHKVPVVKTEKKGAKLYATIEYERPGWQRVLGADSRCQRTFGLDAYGREVYESCDGKRSVKTIIARFAKSHHISLPEAEVAVTAFMKTLMTKGLVAIAVGKE